MSHLCESFTHFGSDVSERIWYLTLRFARTVKDFVKVEADHDLDDFDVTVTSLLLRAIKAQKDVNRRRKLDLVERQ